MPKGSSKGTAAIQRLLEERRQYEAWIARLDSAADATPASVRVRVKADYEARLQAVTEELKTHVEAARQIVAQRKEFLAELRKKEAQASERLTETELRHAVGEYDESQWGQVHKDALAELMSVREELQVVESDIEKLEELDALVRKKPAEAEKSAPRVGSPPKPKPEEPKPEKKAQPVDELAFLKSVTEDSRSGPSAKRASGAQYQPSEPVMSPPGRPGVAAEIGLPADADDPGEAVKTLKCKDCGTMNLATEWYCESCGAELAAL
ncbi:MAG TPA: hypothetical protein VNG95_01485 [Gemmatimonadales bacterium]|nr:hypothetical protein [Gemmatimonadales bacterium]